MKDDSSSSARTVALDLVEVSPAGRGLDSSSSAPSNDMQGSIEIGFELISPTMFVIFGDSDLAGTDFFSIFREFVCILNFPGKFRAFTLRFCRVFETFPVDELFR